MRIVRIGVVIGGVFVGVPKCALEWFVFGIVYWDGYVTYHSSLFPAKRGCARRYVIPSICLVWIRLTLWFALSRSLLSSSSVMGMCSIIVSRARMTDLLVQTWGAFEDRMVLTNVLASSRVSFVDQSPFFMIFKVVRIS